MILTKNEILAEALARSANHILQRGRCSNCTQRCEKTLHGAIDCAAAQLNETGRILGHTEPAVTDLIKELALNLLKNLK